MARHRHADLIHAWAEGAEIDVRTSATFPRWMPVSMETPLFYADREYRIRPKEPERKPDVVKNLGLEAHGLAGIRFSEGFPMSQWKLRVTFSGDTGKLIKAEVL